MLFELVFIPQAISGYVTRLRYQDTNATIAKRGEREHDEKRGEQLT